MGTHPGWLFRAQVHMCCALGVSGGRAAFLWLLDLGRLDCVPLKDPWPSQGWLCSSWGLAGLGRVGSSQCSVLRETVGVTVVALLLAGRTWRTGTLLHVTEQPLTAQRDVAQDIPGD